VIGGLVWASLLTAWMDGWPWRFGVAITALMLVNPGLYLLTWKLGNVAGLIATVLFLWFGLGLGT
jgi:hypothetical protein